jgi:dTDP-4-dehydrorhamnose reductase
MAGLPILVIGAEGQLARALGRHRRIDSHPIVCRGRPNADVTDPSALQRVFGAYAPAAVVNAAGYTAVDEAEGEARSAFAVNAEGAERLACLCRDRQIPLVHVSTDYVFDGTGQRPYCETDPIAPLGVYGASKAAGEADIRRAHAGHVILRTAWLYSRDGQNFLNAMLRLGAEREEICVVNDQLGTPTWTGDVAAAIVTILRRLLTNSTENLWGTYHLTNRGETTWLGFASEILRLSAAAGHPTPRLKAVTTDQYAARAARPAYSVLDNRKIEAAFGIRLPPWQVSLARCLAAAKAEEKVA